MATVEVRDIRAPAWRGGFGRSWSAAALSSFGDALRTAALPLLAGAPPGALLGGAAVMLRGPNTPALLAAAFFALSVAALIPRLRTDVSVVEPEDDGTTAHVAP